MATPATINRILTINWHTSPSPPKSSRARSWRSYKKQMSTQAMFLQPTWEEVAVHSSWDVTDSSDDCMVKSVAVSPDATCILAVKNRTLCIFEGGSPGPSIEIDENESVYDSCWLPKMSSADPATCAFASTARGHPIHLWDGYTGALRATYKPYNHLDEIWPAHSVCFDLQSERVYAGFDRVSSGASHRLKLNRASDDQVLRFIPTGPAM